MNNFVTQNAYLAGGRNLGKLYHGRLARYVPGFILGVFLARVVGEWMGLPGVWAAVALSAVLGFIGALLLARRSPRQTWPALILSAYIAYPEPYPTLAAHTAAIALTAFLLDRFFYGERLPTESRSLTRLDWLPAILIGIGFFLIYLYTLAPGVLPADSGELQVVAAQLGVAHPPGFPLYVMVAHLFTRLLPFVSAAFAVNLFSAVTSALTVAVVYLAGATLTGRRLPGLITAIALGFAPTFWSQATTANVRSLTGLFAALIILTLLRFRAAATCGDKPAADRWLTLAALFAGFGVTHHVSLLFLVAVGLLFVAVVDPLLFRAPGRWVRPIAAGLLGLLPLFYLPLRAAADVRGASPDLATWTGFLEHVLATGFRGDLFYYLAPTDLWARLRIMGNVMGFQFGPWLLVGMAAGFLLLLRRDRPAALLLGGAFAVFTLVAATYRAPQTVEYMIPGYIAATLLLAVAVAWLPAEAALLGRPAELLGVLLAALIVVGAATQLSRNRTASGAAHEGTTARDYAGRLLAEAPADAVILAHWHWATPLWYLQEVERARPDVATRFVFPEGEPYEITWERRTREALAEGRPVITTWVPVEPLAELPMPEPIGEALLYPQEPRHALPPGYAATNVILDDTIRIVGYHTELPSAAAALAPGDESAVVVAWEPVEALPAGTSLFLHYVGADGVLYGQDDRPATAAGDGLTLTRFRVTSRPATPVGPLTIYVGVAGESGSARERLTDIDITTSSVPPFTRNRTARVLSGAPADRLVGYDWDRTLADRARLYLHWQTADGYRTEVVDDSAADTPALPPYRGPWGVSVAQWQFPRGRNGGHYVPLGEGIVWTGETFNGVMLAPGEAVVIDQEFHSARPINRDYVVSVRLIGLESDGVHWAWWDLQDAIPAMGAIPTLKWIAGSFVRSPHRVTAAETATPGQALTGALTLYDAFTNRPLSILDERMTAENPWVPLCRGVVEEE